MVCAYLLVVCWYLNLNLNLGGEGIGGRVVVVDVVWGSYSLVVMN